MKAIVTMAIEKPTRFGRKVITETFNARKEVLESEVNKFIFQRQHRENFINVTEFSVKLFDYNKRVYKSWSYKPTYRQ